MAKIILVETATIRPGNNPRGQAPQGLLLIAGALKKAGHNVEIIDGFIKAPLNKRPIKLDWGVVHEFGLPNDKLVSLVLSKNPDIVGITYMLTIEHDIKADFIKQLKQKAVSMPVVVGGTAASAIAHGILGAGFPSEKIDGVDFVIKGTGVGLGEETMVKLVKLLTQKETISREDYFYRLRKLEGIVYFDETRKEIVDTLCPLLNLQNYQYGYDRLFLEKALSKEFPERYSELNNAQAGPTPYPPQTEITTSNGCPFSCEFCHICSFKEELQKSELIKGIQEDKFWDRLPMKIINKEISKIKEEGYQTINFEDDNFFGYLPSHFRDGLEILSFCIKLGFKCVRFSNGLTISSLLANDAEILHKLGQIARSGIFIRFAISIESGSDDTLKNYIRKPHTKKMILQLLNSMQKSKYLELVTFQPEAFFVFGVVNAKGEMEPLENIQESREFLLSVAKKYKIPISVFGCVPNPPNIHYHKYIQTTEEKKEKVNWPEFLFSQVLSLSGQEDKALFVNKIIRETREQLRKEGLLHIRSAHFGR